MCEPNDFSVFNLRVFMFWFDRESILGLLLMYVD